MSSIVLEHSDLVFLFAFMPDVDGSRGGGGSRLMEKKGDSFTLIKLVVISRFCRLEIDRLMPGSFKPQSLSVTPPT